MSGADAALRRGAAAGLSVLELVVALAIFAVAALTGAEVLYATLSVDRQLDARHQQTEAVALTLMLARRDLRDALTLQTGRAGGAAAEVRMAVAGTALDPVTLTSGVSDVVWQWSQADQRLRRGVAGPDGRMLFADLLTGVEAFEARIVAETETSRLVSIRLTVTEYGDLVVTEVAP